MPGATSRAASDAVSVRGCDARIRASLSIRGPSRLPLRLSAATRAAAAPAEHCGRRGPSSEPHPRNAAVRRCVLREGLRAARVPRALSSPHDVASKPWRARNAAAHARRYWRAPTVTYARIPQSARLSRPSLRVMEGSNPRDGLVETATRQQIGRCNASRRVIHGDGSELRALTALLES